MKLYRYTFGEWINYGPAKDDADAFERRIAIDPQFHYVPVTIEEVKLEGYEIIVSRHSVGDPNILKDYLATTDKTELKAYLKSNDIDFVPQWSEERLRELALQHYAVAN
jgi:hypothetical protein